MTRPTGPMTPQSRILEDTRPLWEPAMALAIEEATIAASHGDVPVGCVIVNHAGIVSTDHNRVELHNDPTAHAEILAVKNASTRLGRRILNDCVAVVTLEPCLMCCGAMIQARIAGLVFATPDPKAGAVLSLYTSLSDGRLNHTIPHLFGLKRNEASAQLAAFFDNLRNHSRLHHVVKQVSPDSQ